MEWRGEGGGGRYQEGEECGVAESSATEEYFRVVANHLPALRTIIGGRRIPNSTAKQQSIHGNVQTRCRHATLLSIASSDDLCLQGKSYLLIYTYTYNHCAYFIHERHNATATTTTTTPLLLLLLTTVAVAVVVVVVIAVKGHLHSACPTGDEELKERVVIPERRTNLCETEFQQLRCDK